MILKNHHLYKGDCLEIMDNLIADGVEVDAIITDPPYGTTSCKWDTVIPLDKMWERLKKLRKERTPVVLFGSEPFSSALRMSNIKEYKYDWIWEKEQGTNQNLCSVMPMKNHEMISVFYLNHYYPCFSTGKAYHVKRFNKIELDPIIGTSQKKVDTVNSGKRYPKSIIKFNRDLKNRKHPTQKPVKLLEYLVKTYTRENGVVLDFTMGSGSTGVACVNTSRNFIGIEKEDNYYDIAVNRINEAMKEKEDYLDFSGSTEESQSND